MIINDINDITYIITTLFRQNPWRVLSIYPLFHHFQGGCIGSSCFLVRQEIKVRKPGSSIMRASRIAFWRSMGPGDAMKIHGQLGHLHHPVWVIRLVFGRSAVALIRCAVWWLLGCAEVGLLCLFGVSCLHFFAYSVDGVFVHLAEHISYISESRFAGNISWMWYLIC